MKFQLALCQLQVVDDKAANLDKAEEMIRAAAGKGAAMVALPEMFNCPYSNRYFPEYAEEESGLSWTRLSSIAADLGIYLIGGSIPERVGERIYNTSYSFDPSGKQIGKHRKAHLFDIDVKGGIRFVESETLTPGSWHTVFDTEFCKVGVAICYDVRFPELIRRMTLDGAKLIVLPGAFNMTTGPAHWDLTMRARALDNQIYFAAVSPARDVEGVYQAFGSSCVVNPWGEFSGKTDSRESIVLAEIDLEYLEQIREQLPLLAHRKPELY